MKDRILVAIPMYNCEKQITRVIDKFSPEVQRLISAVMIIDNGSNDQSVEVASEYIKKITVPSFLLRNQDNYHLGGSQKVAFNFGIKHNFSHVIILHGDDQADIRDFIQPLRDGLHWKADCLLGSRFAGGARRQGYSMVRTLGNLVFNVLFSLVTRRWVNDLGSGLNCFRCSWLSDRCYLSAPDDLTFNYHLVFWFAAKQTSTIFYPISWREEDQVSNVHLKNQTIRMTSQLYNWSTRGLPWLEQYHGRFSRDGYLSDVTAHNDLDFEVAQL